MALERIYLDHNATAPLLPAVRSAMVGAFDLPGNASSIHAEGRAARAAVEQARAQVATLLGVRPRDITFTSGGTEAANLVLSPALSDGGKPLTRLLVAAGEHACVLQGHRFQPDAVQIVPLKADGQLDLAALKTLLTQADGERVLLALQAANNETGVIQPVAEAAALVHEAGGLVVCDAVQAAGRIPLQGLGADSLFISAHKIGGPKGIGALAFANTRLHISGGALVKGGGQEKGLRAGTENVAGIVGFGAAAAQVAGQGLMAGLVVLRDRLEADVARRMPDAVFFGQGVARLPQTSSFAVPSMSAETLLIALDLAGIAVSSGSACSSGKVQPSHVLLAMGVEPDLAKGALRVSLGAENTDRDIEAFCEALDKSVRNIRARSQMSAA